MMQKHNSRTKRKHVEVFTYTALDEMLASPTQPYPVDFQRHQLTRMYGGLASIENAPNPSTDDWRVCSDAVNLMETLVTMGIVEDSSGLLMDAVEALAMAGKRHHTHGVIRLDAKGIQAVRAVLEDYAECLAVLSCRTMIRCHRLTERRIREIMKGRLKPHDVEVMAL
jgi:hypothetical protein